MLDLTFDWQAILSSNSCRESSFKSILSQVIVMICLTCHPICHISDHVISSSNAMNMGELLYHFRFNFRWNEILELNTFATVPMDSITITGMESVNGQMHASAARRTGFGRRDRNYFGVRWTLKKNDGLAHRPCSSGSPDLCQADTRPGYCDGVTNIPAYLNDDQTCTGYLKCDEFGGQFQCDCPAGLMWNKDWFYDTLSMSHKILLIQSLKKWP